MKNREILEGYKNLIDLRSYSKPVFPVKVSFSILRNIKILQPIVDDIENERMRVVKQYGEPVPDDHNYYRPKEGNEEVMQKELDNLMNIENDVSLHTISINDLNGMSLSLSDMDKLYFMISEG